MSSQELIKFLTKEFVQYVETPKEERMKQKQLKREQRGTWSEHWFGVLPTVLFMTLKPLFAVAGKIVGFSLKWLKPSRYKEQTKS